eukprot:COSAG05_NODE_1363_length_5081_cov_1.577479_1_plen_325_part_00
MPAAPRSGGAPTTLDAMLRQAVSRALQQAPAHAHAAEPARAARLDSATQALRQALLQRSRRLCSAPDQMLDTLELEQEPLLELSNTPPPAVRCYSWGCSTGPPRQQQPPWGDDDQHDECSPTLSPPCSEAAGATQGWEVTDPTQSDHREPETTARVAAGTGERGTGADMGGAGRAREPRLLLGTLSHLPPATASGTSPSPAPDPCHARLPASVYRSCFSCVLRRQYPEHCRRCCPGAGRGMVPWSRGRLSAVRSGVGRASLAGGGGLGGGVQSGAHCHRAFFSYCSELETRLTQPPRPTPATEISTSIHARLGNHILKIRITLF